MASNKGDNKSEYSLILGYMEQNSAALTALTANFTKALADFRSDFDSRMSILQSRLVSSETGTKFHVLNIENNTARIVAVENKVHKLELENVKIQTLERDMRSNEEKFEAAMNIANKQYNKSNRTAFVSQMGEKIFWIGLTAAITTFVMIIIGLK